MTERIALIDYGAGNLRSVHNALMAAGADSVEVTADPDYIYSADRIVLPGVGAFSACMEALLRIEGMPEILENAVYDKGRPFLGICVGMQMMAEYGTEFDKCDGLSWVSGSIEPIKPSVGAKPNRTERLLHSGDQVEAIKVPHMGWNTVKPVGPESLIVPGEAYFLHGYAFVNNEMPSPVRAVTDHGGEIVAAIQSGPAIGVQFHPEKSQKYGLDFLSRFLDWKP